MRCAGAAADLAAARMRAAGEAMSSDQAAGDRSPVASAEQSAATHIADVRGNSPRTAPSPAVSAAGGNNDEYIDPELQVDYSSESDTNPHSQHSSPRSPERGGNNDDGPGECRDQDVLRVAPQNKPWALPQRHMQQWAGMTTARDRIPLFDSSRLHGLDARSRDYSREHDFYIDVFLKHRWFNGSRNNDATALVQAWNAFIHNFESFGREAWLEKLIAARNRFERRTAVGARYRLHRLSREAGLPCLSWGDHCLSCVDNRRRAPKEAYLLNHPYWRMRMSSDMYEGIDTLQSLYARAGRTFSDGPPGSSDAPHRTGLRGQKRPSSAGSEVPSCQTRVDTHAIGRGNSSEPPLKRGGAKYAPPESASSLVNPPKVVVEEGKPDPDYRSGYVARSTFDRVTDELHDELSHERSARRKLNDLVQELRLQRETDRAASVQAQLENERAVRSLRDELAAVQRDAKRDHKNLREILERGGYLRRKKSRTDSTDEGGQHKT